MRCQHVERIGSSVPSSISSNQISVTSRLREDGEVSHNVCPFVVRNAEALESKSRKTPMQVANEKLGQSSERTLADVMFHEW